RAGAIGRRINSLRMSGRLYSRPVTNICGILFESWNPNGSSAYATSRENARAKESPIRRRASAKFCIRARLALLQTMTAPASAPRNCATWAFGNKDRGELDFDRLVQA